MSVLTLRCGVVNMPGGLADGWTGHFPSAYLNHIPSTWQPGPGVSLNLADAHSMLIQPYST